MDPMGYTFQQQPGSPAQGNSNSLHNNPASWLAPQSYLGQLPYHPGPFANPFVHQRPVQPSPGFSQPSQAPLQNSYSSPRHSGGAMMGDATHASSQTLGSWSMHAPVSAAPAPPNLNYGFPGNYDSFGGQSGWPGYMESISTGFSPYQSPPPAVNTPRHGTANASAAAGRHSLPRIQTISPASANARSQPSQSSSSTFSPSAAPFTPGQARYQTNPQPSLVSSSSGVASVSGTLSYGKLSSDDVSFPGAEVKFFGSLIFCHCNFHAATGLKLQLYQVAHVATRSVADLLCYRSIPTIFTIFGSK
jgi:hypothetical protein